MSTESHGRRRQQPATVRGYVCVGEEAKAARLRATLEAAEPISVREVAGHRGRSLFAYEDPQSAYVAAGQPLPCALFQVEGPGRMLPGGEREIRSPVTVVTEGPIHLVFGPQGRLIQALLNAVALLDPAHLQRWQDFDSLVERVAGDYEHLRVGPDTEHVTDYLRLHTSILAAVDDMNRARSPRLKDVDIARDALWALLARLTPEVRRRSWERALPVVSDLTSVLMAPEIPEQVAQDVYNFWGLRLAAIRESARELS